MRRTFYTLLSWLNPRKSPAGVSIDGQLTDRARLAVRLAEQEARRLNHEYLGTEHLLFGLVQDDRGVAANVMQVLIGNLEILQQELKSLMIACPAGVPRPRVLEVTPRARTALDTAVEEARLLNHSFIGTEHLLLGLRRDPEGVPAQIFLGLGVEASRLRQEVLALLGKIRNE
jgi:ATP-dependent Clp protease ATP-binding subunit ClpC